MLDPFCGRGTTIFAARLRGHEAFGIDCSLVATSIARAKIARCEAKDVMALAERTIGEAEPTDVPEGEFWEWAFADTTLRDLCALRENLRKRYGGGADLLRAICLGALHGPLTKDPKDQSYFSNQMPRTFAAKPKYSVSYWRSHGLQPCKVDVLRVIRKRLERLNLTSIPQCVGKPTIRTADSRRSSGYADFPKRVDLVLTSPPYYGMRTYISDQWLRNWFLGGPPDVTYQESGQLSHSSPEAFIQSLARVWNRVGKLLADDGRMFIRFGAIPSRLQDPRKILRRSLENSKHPWREIFVRPADSASYGRRQAEYMGNRVKSAATQEYDFQIGLL